MIKHFALTLSGSQQNVGAVSTVPEGDAKTPIRWISFQAKGSNSNLAYIGGSGLLVSSSTYLSRIEIPVSTIPSAPTVFEFGESVTNLSQWSVLGTNNEVLLVGYAT